MNNDGFGNFVFALLIIAFTYFYAVTINPTQMAEDLKGYRIYTG